MKVLVADDDPVVRAVVANILTDQGDQVVEAVDGVTAIQTFYAELPDMVVLDLRMPRMSGYLACRLLKEDPAASSVPILLLTAYGSPEDRYWGEHSGADDYLTKQELDVQLPKAFRRLRSTLELSALSDAASSPVRLDASAVLGRVAGMLDRKLFEMTIVNEILTAGAATRGVGPTAADTLASLRRFVEFDMAAVALNAEGVLHLARFDGVAVGPVPGFVGSATEFMDRVGLSAPSKGWRQSWIPSDHVDADAEPRWGSFFAAALYMRNRPVGVLTLAARAEDAFPPETARTLRLIELPLATVLDAALHYQEALAGEARRSLAELGGPSGVV